MAKEGLNDMADWLRYTIVLAAVIICGFQYLIIKKMDDVPAAETKAQRGYLRLLFPAVVAVAVYLLLMGGEFAILSVWSELLMLSALWCIAYVDYREHLIPNRLLLAVLVARAAIFLCEVACYASDALETILTELLGCLVLLAFCMLLRFLSRKGLGMGDVKLIAILPLFFGSLGGMRVTFYAMLIIFVQSCFCLLAKKKGRKDLLPFAPAIAGGAWVYVILSVF